MNSEKLIDALQVAVSALEEAEAVLREVHRDHAARETSIAVSTIRRMVTEAKK